MSTLAVNPQVLSIRVACVLSMMENLESEKRLMRPLEEVLCDLTHANDDMMWDLWFLRTQVTQALRSLNNGNTEEARDALEELLEMLGQNVQAKKARR